jgi:hypothetical protein
MPDWSESYPAVYRSLAPAYRELPRPQVEQALRGVFGEASSLDAVEGFFDDLGHTFGGIGRAVGNVASQAAPVLAKVAPSVLSGVAGGAALGPLGMVGGGLAGLLGGLLGSGAPGSQRPPAGVPAGPAGVVGQLAGSASGLLGGGAGSTGAIGQLLAALGSPTVQQGLNSMLLGPAGNRTVPTPGGSAVPVAAITNLLSLLANRASSEWESMAPFGEADYISEGIDTASPEARAAWLYGQLAPLEISVGEEPEAFDESWIDEMYDQLEAEFYRDR